MVFRCGERFVRPGGSFQFFKVLCLFFGLGDVARFGAGWIALRGCFSAFEGFFRRLFVCATDKHQTNQIKTSLRAPT